MVIARTPRALFGVAVGLVTLGGCTALAGLGGDYTAALPDAASEDASSLPDADDHADALARDASPSPGDAGLSSDAGDPPPPLVAVAGGYAIGEREVTRREYAAWLATRPTPSGQPAACAWNSTFTPDAACMARACAGVACLEHPQVCVDWCDAAAFCRGVGQRLCGRIGGGGEAPADYASPTASQWFAACSEEGARAFPYGNGYHVDYCNGGDNQQTGCGKGGLCQTAIAGSSTRCFADALDGGKVMDLSGNAWEWTDACTAAGDGGAREAACRIRGGSYLVPGDVRLRCLGDATLDVARRGAVAEDIGFRCCSP